MSKNRGGGGGGGSGSGYRMIRCKRGREERDRRTKEERIEDFVGRMEKAG